MLRITSGEYRNRRITVPETGMIRPMLEKPRMALFSILGQDIAKGRSVLDAFAGSGVLGLEALSRGAAHAYFFDLERKHTEALNGVIKVLKCEARCTVRAGDAMKLVAPGSRLFTTAADRPPVGLVFLDPPHAVSMQVADPEKGALAHPFWDWFGALAAVPGIANDAVVVLGHHAELEAPVTVGPFTRFDLRRYGGVAISLYSAAGVAGE
jgi:16S rRNA (guanine966-N2)-methyltransferase